MKKPSYRPFILGIAALLLLLTLPLALVQNIREGLISAVTPLWEGVLLGKDYFLHPSETWELQGRLETDPDALPERVLESQQALEIARLRQENALLQNALGHMMGAGYAEKATPARVIFRDPSSWSSSLWINIGRSANHDPSHPLIEKNSPVCLGENVVGLIDYVGEKQSRVRLLSDSGLSPSVRAVRGGEVHFLILQQIDDLLESLKGQNDLFANSQDLEILKQNLWLCREALKPQAKTWYLAKGEIHGSGAPLWRGKGHLLKGIGFNMDFPDEMGPARDLRSGEPIHSQEEARPILQEGDLLITSGMDGVFPKGLRVGVVNKIFPLQEGAYYYSLEASPSVSDLDRLETVFVLPPYGFYPEDQPSSSGF